MVYITYVPIDLCICTWDVQLASVNSRLRVTAVPKLRSNSNVDEETAPVSQFFKVGQQSCDIHIHYITYSHTCV